MFNRTNYLPILLLLGLADLGPPAPCRAQTTQGVIGGTVFSGELKHSVADAVVEYFRRENGTVVETGSTRTNAAGFYAFLFLPPGMYQVRVCIAACDQISEYQPQEVYGLELFVAARLEVNFAVRKLTDVWKAGIAKGLYQDSTTAIIHYYASDVAQLRSAYLQLVPYQASSLEASVSYVIDPKSVENLPLSGRDIYATLVLQPGVTADSATTRGLGLSANGQRPTSSNFLLDGVENNNYFLTGSLTPISPEAMQEYRVSVSSFSAEYGRTAGFLANAITRAGGNDYHGLLFGYLGNDLLNANSFQANAHGEPRVSDHELHAGYEIGGRILRDRLFFSSEFEQFRSRTLDSPQNVCLPVLSKFPAQDKGHLSAQLLAQLPIVAAATPLSVSCDGTPLGGEYRWSPTISIDRSLGLDRLDYVSPGGADRVLLRSILSRSSRPDFIASPYQGLDSRLSEDSTGAALGYTHNLAPNATNQLRLGWTNYDLHWNRPHSEIPQLQAEDLGVELPSSDLPYAFADRENHWELSDSVSLVRGYHVITAGGGILLRRQRSVLPFLSDGVYYFGSIPSVNCNTNSIQAFADDFPCVYGAALQYNYDSLHNTVSPYPATQPDPARSYANQQFDFFLQDTWRPTAHLSLSAGLRYESLGTLKETGAQDLYVQAGPGASPYAQLQTARTVLDPSSERSLYHPDRLDWAPRLGISYAQGKTLVRAGYGIYYDPPPDTLTESSRLNNVTFFSPALLPKFQLLPPLEVLAPYISTSPGVRAPVWIDANLSSARVTSWFASVERPLSPDLTLEVMYLGSSGRGLVTSDQVNRNAGVIPSGTLKVPTTYVGNQGFSFYEALATVLRYRTRSVQFQLSYTWSHSIDNQSDPLLGGVDLGSATVSGSGSSSNTVLFSCSGPCNPANFAFFSRQFDWHADRGSSDFDQRHNLIFYSLWDLPYPRTPRWSGRILSGWQASQLAGFRSGFPVNVYGESPPGVVGASSFFLTNRPNLTGLPVLNSAPQAVPGGLTLLNPAAFETQLPPEGSAGGLGRNSIAGPGFWNVDISIARSFHLFGKEANKLQLRGDFFNVFNHANLGAPDGYMNAPYPIQLFNSGVGYNPAFNPAFGQAFYGVSRQTTGLTAFAPLAAQQRQIQFQIKLFF